MTVIKFFPDYWYFLTELIFLASVHIEITIKFISFLFPKATKNNCLWFNIYVAILSVNGEKIQNNRLTKQRKRKQFRIVGDKSLKIYS